MSVNLQWSGVCLSIGYIGWLSVCQLVTLECCLSIYWLHWSVVYLSSGTGVLSVWSGACLSNGCVGVLTVCLCILFKW